MKKMPQAWNPPPLPKEHIRYMSDAEWTRLFTVLASSKLNIGKIYYCMTWDFNLAVGETPCHEDKAPHYPCHENCGWGCIRPTYVYSFTAPDHRWYYREIAYLHIPAKWFDEPYEKVPFAHHHHDLDAIESDIQSIDRYEMARTESGLTIFGYIPNKFAD
jgi:hypothetical protein